MMGARNPAAMVEVINIDLPRPRPLAVRESAEFSRLRRTASVTTFAELGIVRGNRCRKAPASARQRNTRRHRRAGRQLLLCGSIGVRIFQGRRR